MLSAVLPQDKSAEACWGLHAGRESLQPLPGRVSVVCVLYTY